MEEDDEILSGLGKLVFYHYLKCFLQHFLKVVFIFYTLLFHSLFKVKFNIDNFVLGEHRER